MFRVIVRAETEHAKKILKNVKLRWNSRSIQSITVLHSSSHHSAQVKHSDSRLGGIVDFRVVGVEPSHFVSDRVGDAELGLVGAAHPWVLAREEPHET